MYGHCSYLFCNFKSKPDNKLSYHKFPLRNAECLQKWIDAMGQEDFVPRNHHKLCSAHFEPSMFYGGDRQRRRLREDAVPSLFEAPVKRVKMIPGKSLLSSASSGESAVRSSEESEASEQCAKGKPCDPGQEVERPLIYLFPVQLGLQEQASSAAGPSDAATTVVDPGAPQERASPASQDDEPEVAASSIMEIHSYYCPPSGPRARRRLPLAHLATHGKSSHHQQPFIHVASPSSPDEDEMTGMDSPEASCSSYPTDVAATPQSKSVGAREHPVSSFGQDDEDIDPPEASSSSTYLIDVEGRPPSERSVARESPDRSREDTPEKEFLRRAAQQYAAMYNASRKKVKALQQSQRRLKLKVEELKAIITELEAQRSGV